MMSAFHYEKDTDGIVTVTMDMSGPVNAMNDEYSETMSATLDRLESENDLTGVVMASAKKTFFAGADLNWLVSVKPGMEAEMFDAAESGKALLRRLEKLPVPVVAAINGAALGGGYELCLAANRRIAWNDRRVQVGLPEVSLGLLPGGGGIVRLTSLLGLEKALPFLLEGRKLAAAQAESEGLVDETVSTLDELLPRARAWILENRNDEGARQAPWDRKDFRIPGGGANSPAVMQALAFAAVMVFKKTRGLLPAPERILSVAAERLGLDFDTASRVESRAFAGLATGTVAKNMITAFFFDLNKVNGGASRPQGVEPGKISRLGVIGAGMMGQGIAYVAAMAGVDVILKDVSIENAEKGKTYSDRLLSKLVKKGAMDDNAKQAILSKIKVTDQDQALDGCELVIEAVFENMELKHEVTRSTESRLAENGVWGSNTSTLPITRLAEASARPERFIGIHFFSPVDKMPLVELICGKQTSDETLARAFDFVHQIKKTPIVVTDSLGFYTSRTIGTELQEAAQLIAEGVHPTRIENLGRALGWPVGPLVLNDETSQKLSVAVYDTQEAMGLRNPEDDPNPQATKLWRTMVNEYGRGGRHHGGGYYDYDEAGKTLWPKLVELYYKADYRISDGDIKDRLLFRPVIESMKCLEEGVLRSVADGNIGSILGIGAPVWTGGYLQFANTYGLERFVKRCRELASCYGARFEPPAIAVDKARTGESIR